MLAILISKSKMIKDPIEHLGNLLAAKNEEVKLNNNQDQENEEENN